jgi:hypothetical protein
VPVGIIIKIQTITIVITAIIVVVTSTRVVTVSVMDMDPVITDITVGGDSTIITSPVDFLGVVKSPLVLELVPDFLVELSPV